MLKIGFLGKKREATETEKLLSVLGELWCSLAEKLLFDFWENKLLLLDAAYVANLTGFMDAKTALAVFTLAFLNPGSVKVRYLKMNCSKKPDPNMFPKCYSHVVFDYSFCPDDYSVEPWECRYPIDVGDPVETDYYDLYEIDYVSPRLGKVAMHIPVPIAKNYGFENLLSSLVAERAERPPKLFRHERIVREEGYGKLRSKAHFVFEKSCLLRKAVAEKISSELVWKGFVGRLNPWKIAYSWERILWTISFTVNFEEIKEKYGKLLTPIVFEPSVAQYIGDVFTWGIEKKYGVYTVLKKHMGDKVFFKVSTGYYDAELTIPAEKWKIIAEFAYTITL